MIIFGSIGLLGMMTVFADSAETPSNNPLPSSSTHPSLPWEGPAPDKYNFPPAFGIETSAQITGGPDAFGYTWAEDGEASCSYDFIDISETGTGLDLFDDSVSPAIPLDFLFFFYGQPQTEVYVSSNGFIGFDPLPSSGCCQGAFLPTIDGLENIIALFWEDLTPSGAPYPGATAGIYYETVGNAPNRTFIVQYEEVPHFFDGPLVTAQIQLQESTGEVRLVYQDAPFQIDGAFTSIGIENSDATDGLTYFYGEVGPIADQVCFTPPESDVTIEKTLGLKGKCTTDNLSAPAGSEVTYCFEVTNTSAVTTNFQTINDDHLGSILDIAPIILPPGGITTVVVGPVTVTTDTINTVVWETCVGDPTPIAPPPEPINDTFGGMIHDISDVEITSDASSVSFAISFVGPISPTGSGSFADLYGYFELDVDPSSNSGFDPVANFFCPEPHDVLVDYTVPFFTPLTNTVGTIPVLDSVTGVVIGNARYEFNSPDLILTFDRAIFDIDPSTVEYSSLFGDDFGPTDCANNTPITPEAQCTVHVDAAVFTVGDALDVNLSQLDTNTKPTLMPIIVLTNLMLLTLITLFYRKRKAA